ncbi:hypothetical protein ASE16_02230 [Leifsonia sp. Root227]|uniref:sugar phosphate isomerase/epimerase family protein n=1 Tax=Leifsonia sp. Root227 TaxID=1736496 RepID=UPI0006F250FB|nr:TIM barrel protein [Leifsonia sp. Root227]KRC51909.1 hypothetical protein ASE16_02230 [Leifsonia sp. Root227]
MTRRLGFSTLGSSGAGVDQIVRIALEGRAFGVELRAADDEAIHIDLDAAVAAEIGRVLADAGITVLCVASYVSLCAQGDSDVLERHLDLARQLGAGGVRVFMKDDDADPSEQLTAGEERALSRLDRVVGSDVSVLIETHDSHSSARRLARFLRAADSSVPGHAGRVLWDTAHSWSHGETLAESLAELRPWLSHLQIKDERSMADPVPVALGAGSFPVAELAAALDAESWSGWLALEWERKWHPALPSLNEALMAAHTWAAPLLTPERERTQ